MRRHPGLLESAVHAAAAVFAWIGISFSTVFWTTLIAVVWLLHRWADPERRLIHRLCSFWGRTLTWMAPGCRIRLSGLENIPAGRPVIFMANHQSYVDVPALFSMPGQFRWMADADLFRIPVFGWAMLMAGYMPVNRGNAKEGVRALDKAKAWLGKGISVFLFPEGTRSHTGVFGRYQMGGFRLAVESGAPVVPVLVIGTRQLLPRGSWVFRWGVPIEIRFLSPETFPQEMPAARIRSRALRTRMWKEFASRLRSVRMNRASIAS